MISRIEAYPPGSIQRARVQQLDAHAAASGTGPDGRELRIPGGVPGDVLDVEVVSVGKKEIWTRIRRVVEPSPDRITPPCPILDRCGTCPWQAVRYRVQLQEKARHLRAALDAIPALAGAPIADPIGTLPPVGYRTKIQMPAGGRPGGLHLGFFAPRSHRLVRVDHCAVQSPIGEAVRNGLLTVLNRHRVSPYDEHRHEGELRAVLVRVGEQTGALLVVTSLESRDWALLAAELAAIPGLDGIWLNENPERTNAVLGSRSIHLAGARRLRDRVGDLPVERVPGGFFQTNHRASEVLVRVVRELAGPTPGAVLDLYAGGGMLAAAVGASATRLDLVESNPDAAGAARATLKLSGLDGGHVHRARAEDLIPDLVAGGTRWDTVLVDPPRAGVAPEVMAALIRAAPTRVVMVSCYQKTLLRDLQVLAASGWALTQVHPVDMFPHTPHLETVALLTRPASTAPNSHAAS